MIKINLSNKLSNMDVKMNSKSFLTNYADKIIDRKFKQFPYTKNKTTQEKEYIDQYYFDVTQSHMKNKEKNKITILDIFIFQHTKNQDFRNLCTKLRKLLNISFTSGWERVLIKKVITLSPSYLDKLVKLLDKCNLDNKILKIIKSMFDYEDSRKVIVKFVRQLNFKVCIYCNRNYINNFTKKITDDTSTNDIDRQLFTLDHYHQHADYPLLALSFFNLIPSCHVCNSLIKSKRNNLNQFKNPYNKSYNFQELATFKLLKAKKVKLTSDDEECKKYIEDFYINEVYKTHASDVAEELNKRDIFTDNLISQYAKISNTTEENVKDAVFGENISIEDFDQKPLSKLKYDIQKQIKIK